MEIQGTHQFNAPIESVWEALLNPEVLSKALPGGDQLERVGENDYKAAMNVRVGPVQGRFEGQVTLSDIELLKGYRMKVSGTGAPGFLNGEGSLALTAQDDGTLLTYTGDVQVGGRIAAVGQRLIDSTAKSIIRQGLKTLDEQLQRGDSPLDDTPPAVEHVTSPVMAPESVAPTVRASIPTPPTNTSPPVAPKPTAPPPDAAANDFGRMAYDVAKEVVQDLTADYVPREKQPQLVAFIAGALAMLGFVVLVRLVQRN